MRKFTPPKIPDETGNSTLNGTYLNCQHYWFIRTFLLYLANHIYVTLI
jgi:hypothetical protein